MLLAAVACNDNKTTTTMKEITEPMLGLGEHISDNFTGEAWLKMLSAQPEYDCNIYNVTFAPATRNYWHRHSEGQILLCTQGAGYYQTKGKPAERLEPGVIVNIPAGVIHWHGAAPDSQFTHIGITPKVSENNVEWFGPVTDEEYNNAVK